MVSKDDNDTLRGRAKMRSKKAGVDEASSMPQESRSKLVVRLRLASQSQSRNERRDVVHINWKNASHKVLGCSILPSPFIALTSKEMENAEVKNEINTTK
jgi:hypothetical protein